MEYLDYVYCQQNKKIYKSEDANSSLLMTKDPPYSFLSFLPIPQKFKAYVKDDTACHGLEGAIVELVHNSIYDCDFKKTGLIWFKTMGLNVPSDDIDFTTMDICPSYKIVKREEDFTIHPSIGELQHCSISFNNRKTIVTYYDSYVGEAICHEDDTFDVSTGIAVAYTRAYKSKMEFDKKQKEELAKKEIKIGDTVKVINPGENYSSYLEWVYKNVKDFNLVKNYAYNDFLLSSFERDAKFTVKILGEISKFGTKVAYIQNNNSKKCRLINLSAIEKVIE